ncbi:MAG: tRNA (guanosine(46)-N7)-methyltransferase TrmB, partial [Gemmatimonadota bacterium]|nr:tRNA (guanosine(46)-N7)-methyltransferase TrmB [Gemmatimonadota bacterium]
CVGGQLWLATDYADYFDVMLTALETSSCLIETNVEWLGVRTNYEDKFLAQGKPIYRRVMEKMPA